MHYIKLPLSSKQYLLTLYQSQNGVTCKNSPFFFIVIVDFPAGSVPFPWRQVLRSRSCLAPSRRPRAVAVEAGAQWLEAKLKVSRSRPIRIRGDLTFRVERVCARWAVLTFNGTSVMTFQISRNAFLLVKITTRLVTGVQRHFDWSKVELGISAISFS